MPLLTSLFFINTFSVRTCCTRAAPRYEYIRLNCEPSNVTTVIDRLFTLKYISREEDSSDRRIKMISLTKKGEKERQRIIKGTYF